MRDDSEESMTIELSAPETALVVIDFQERLCAAMPADVVERNAANVTHLLTLAARLDLPVVATEQYPQGLGPTIEKVRALLPAAPLPKLEFSVMRNPAACNALRETRRKTAVVVGMEAHVCVFQTVRDLLTAGWFVHVPCDAVVSRHKQNWRVGLDLMRQAGAHVTSTEIVLFDLLKEGRGDAFKEVSKRIR
jgi:nicotinamidase-related amidase